MLPECADQKRLASQQRPARLSQGRQQAVHGGCGQQKRMTQGYGRIGEKSTRPSPNPFFIHHVTRTVRNGSLLCRTRV
uniref:Uncharacterized protein n=1 Tax=mine drainage metagenome TaxID=410659 RepID=E6QK84_9ZZZZ